MFSISAPLSKLFNCLIISTILVLPVFTQDRGITGDLSKSFKQFELVEINNQQAMRDVRRDSELRISTANRNLNLILEQNDLRSKLFRAEDVGSEGMRDIGQTDVFTYRGRVDNEKESHVRLTIDGSRVEGYMISRGDTYYIEPANRYSPDARNGQLVIYKKQDFLGDDGFECPSEMDEKISDGRSLVDSQSLAGLSGPGVIELATEADHEYVNDLGGAVAANNEIMSILNMVEGTFDEDLKLTIQVTYQHTWSVQDPFNGANADALLTSFQSHWNTDSALTAVHRDTTHLFSSKPAVLSMGYAYVGVICRVPSAAYGLSGRITWAPAKFLVTAHELGHNLDAGHADTPEGCGNTIMNPSLSGGTAFSFCPFSREEIGGFNDVNGGCLAPPESESSNAAFDFDGDSKTDTAIYRPSVGQWWYLRSSDGGSRAYTFGTQWDTMVPADYTGDGVTDIAFWRYETGEWFVLRSEDASFYSVPFGTVGDIPAPGDFDGDGKADLGIFRPSTGIWYISNSSGGTTIFPHGTNGDVPVVKDYDGDSKADIAIFRPGVSEWWISKSSGGISAFQFGTAGDKPVPADFTGDGKADVAIWRPASGEWFVLRSEDSSFYSAPFGSNGDVPVPGEYDGDGSADLAIWRPGNNTWYLLGSTDGFQAVAFGSNGDLPVPAAFVP